MSLEGRNAHKSYQIGERRVQSVSKLQAGMKAPDFTSQITSGKTIHLHDYRGKKVVLYFYPKDDTPGCTVEACGLRDEYQKIRELNAEVLGVSVDDTNSHQKFTDKFHLPFPLVADPDKNITKQYGVLNEKSLNSRRVTFIIDEQGKIAKIFETVKPAEHPAEVLEALRA
jgi:thioredoxin-dependent peroxiredoxin